MKYDQRRQEIVVSKTNSGLLRIYEGLVKFLSQG
jgi:hypothetical protein